MMRMAALLLLTVPSDPRPKNTARVTSSASMSNPSATGSDRWVTSSLMPTVKRRRGAGASSASKTDLAMAGVNSLEESP